MDFKQYQDIIFDFDETLATIIIDWSPWYEKVANIFRKYQPDFQDDDGITMQMVSQFITRYGQPLREAYLAFARDFERKTYQGYQKNQAALDLLQTLHQQNKNLYLLTSNTKATILPILSELDISSYFNKIITLDDVTNIKPSAVPFELIYSKDKSKNQYLMIGDSSSDRGFAENADIAFLDVDDIETN